MNELMEYLSEIKALLEQIYTITGNQATVLLTLVDDEGEESNTLDMISQMSDYKDELTQELDRLEKNFEESYSKAKEHIRDEKDLRALKELVAAILEAKEAIIQEEQKNLLIMQSQSKKRLERVSLPQNAKEAAAAYKKQQKKP